MTRIHLVEDDPHSVNLIRLALNETGLVYQLQVSSDGEQAIQTLHRNNPKPHIVLLDLNLPKRTGFEVLDAVKGHPKLRAIPVIVLTNSNMPEDVVKAYAKHCNAYVRKPMGFDNIVEVLKTTSAFWIDVASLPDVSALSTPPQ